MIDVRVKKLKWLLEHENDSVGILECFDMKSGKKEAAKRIHEAFWKVYREGIYERNISKKVDPGTFLKCMKKVKKICGKYGDGDGAGCRAGQCPFAFRNKDGYNDCYFIDNAPLDWDVKEIEKAYREWIGKEKKN